MYVDALEEERHKVAMIARSHYLARNRYYRLFVGRVDKQEDAGMGEVEGESTKEMVVIQRRAPSSTMKAVKADDDTERTTCSTYVWWFFCAYTKSLIYYILKVQTVFASKPLWKHDGWATSI